MELSWLEDFLELARTGNFSRTAELRHLTQPAFSRRIRALEDWAGVSLFDRSAQPITLTDAGRRFLPLAASLVEDLDHARNEARQARAARCCDISGFARDPCPLDHLLLTGSSSSEIKA